MTSEFYSKAD